MIAYWNMTGNLTRSGMSQSLRGAKESAVYGYQRFQEFRGYLGGIKHKLNQLMREKTVTKELLDSLSSYESETVNPPLDEMAPPSDIPVPETPEP